jgi:hypothetical protein
VGSLTFTWGLGRSACKAASHIRTEYYAPGRITSLNGGMSAAQCSSISTTTRSRIGLLLGAAYSGAQSPGMPVNFSAREVS